MKATEALDIPNTGMHGQMMTLFYNLVCPFIVRVPQLGVACGLGNCCSLLSLGVASTVPSLSLTVLAHS